MRILHLARQFAVVHGNDNDILGKMARELQDLIDTDYPEIQKLDADDEQN